jgi:hypothetical protein
MKMKTFQKINVFLVVFRLAVFRPFSDCIAQVKLSDEDGIRRAFFKKEEVYSFICQKF